MFMKSLKDLEEASSTGLTLDKTGDLFINKI